MEQQEIENLNKWHLSKYNIFSTEETEDGKLPCVNLFRGSYSELDLEDIRKLYHLEDFSNIEKELSGFIKQGIIVKFDELTYLQSKAFMSFANGVILSVTIVTTLNCNFNCPYCFETHNGGKINLKLQDKIFELIKNMLKVCGSKKLHISWYGGEPLLAIDVIENLSKKFIQYTKENNIEYDASIITNGYLLNQKIIDLLENYKVNNMQITLDGLKENHNKTRCLANGEPTFDKLIDNLYNIKFLGTINIRHNIHENNYKDIEELKKIVLDIKLKTKNNIRYYSALIINNPAEQRKNQVNFLEDTLALELEADKFAKQLKFCSPFFCSANKLWPIVIGNDGYLYKCWEDVWDKKRSFGFIDSWNPSNPINSASNKDSLLVYIKSIGVFNDQECRECVWLPLCAGNCPSKKIYHNMKCLLFKNNPNYFIKKVKEYKIENLLSVKSK